MHASALADSVFSVKSPADFCEKALQVYRYQKERCAVYRQYLQVSGLEHKTVTRPEDIPFLPISFFRSARVSCEATDELVFTSSGTGGEEPSRHYVSDASIYEKSFRKAFGLFYGPVPDYCILALLPSYLERSSSSLVYMANDLIRSSSHRHSGFYKDDLPGLSRVLEELQKSNQKTLLLGVSYALLDLAELHPMPLQNTIIMETGGMKGKREELTRADLHARLCRAFSTKTIHSEYGMTELLSQAYSKGAGIFECPPWMKVVIRDALDPFSCAGDHTTGGINIIDLANVHSCSFIATQDLGKTYEDGRFEVLGRFDHSDIRGCNLLVD